MNNGSLRVEGDFEIVDQEGASSGSPDAPRSRSAAAASRATSRSATAPTRPAAFDSARRRLRPAAPGAQAGGADAVSAATVVRHGCWLVLRARRRRGVRAARLLADLAPAREAGAERGGRARWRAAARVVAGDATAPSRCAGGRLEVRGQLRRARPDPARARARTTARRASSVVTPLRSSATRPRVLVDRGWLYAATPPPRGRRTTPSPASARCVGIAEPLRHGAGGPADPRARGGLGRALISTRRLDRRLARRTAAVRARAGRRCASCPAPGVPARPVRSRPSRSTSPCTSATPSSGSCSPPSWSAARRARLVAAATAARRTRPPEDPPP